jgi:hypothetical protein
LEDAPDLELDDVLVPFLHDDTAHLAAKPNQTLGAGRLVCRDTWFGAGCQDNGCREAARPMMILRLCFMSSLLCLIVIRQSRPSSCGDPN